MCWGWDNYFHYSSGLLRTLFQLYQNLRTMVQSAIESYSNYFISRPACALQLCRLQDTEASQVNGHPCELRACMYI